ncbi:Hypothetical_protein [Hexamita inflata]|uniref:Hypothetical_protein n=1 Tax=Hexamita inflata TaxID=28002 RepID=A0AA86RCA4_9EUKA|nr:Hypothetical protein HINF_LOCUS57998 [Hexamita inflata]
MQVKPTEYQFERMPYSVMIETALEKKPELAVKGLSKVDKSQLPSAKQQIQTQSTFICEENNNFMKKQQEVKNPDLEHISLLIELERPVRIWPRRPIVEVQSIF